jgi:death-on-curing protein
VADLGLLESALYRPGTGYYADLAEMAAALFESLIMNHPFVDGNKPVAFFATEVFLRLNGYKLKVDAKKAHRFLIGLLEQDRCTFDRLLPWIRKHAVEM